MRGNSVSCGCIIFPAKLYAPSFRDKNQLTALTKGSTFISLDKLRNFCVTARPRPRNGSPFDTHTHTHIERGASAKKGEEVGR